MKKEVIIAIFIGIGIGLVITFGIKTARESLQSELQNPQPELATKSPEVVEAPTHTIIVTSPKDSAIIIDTSTNISGTSTPFALIGAISDTDQNTVMADNQGNFSLSINLSPGANKINLQSYTPLGEMATTTLHIVQTDTKIEAATISATPTLTQ
jgi:hypothetical protein